MTHHELKNSLTPEQWQAVTRHYKRFLTDKEQYQVYDMRKKGFGYPAIARKLNIENHYNLSQQHYRFKKRKGLL